MSIQKVTTTLSNAITLTAGSGQTASSVATTLLGWHKVIHIKLANGATAPVTPATAEVQASPDNINWYTFQSGLNGSTVNSDIVSFTILVWLSVQYVRVLWTAGDTQNVTATAVMSEALEIAESTTDAASNLVSPGESSLTAVRVNAVGGICGNKIGVSNTGNTAGNTGLSNVDWVIAGTNGITASESTTAGGPNTIWISGTNQSLSGGISNLGNTGGTSAIVDKQLVFVGSNGISLSQSVDAASNSATITIAPVMQAFFEPGEYGSLVSSGSLSGIGSSSALGRFQLPYPISASYLRFLMSYSVQSTSFASTPNTTFSCSQLTTFFAVIYSQGTGANSRSLQYVASGSMGFSHQISLQCNSTDQYTVSHNLTWGAEGGAANSNQQTNTAITQTRFDITTNANILGSFGNARVVDIPFANSLAPGVYWMCSGQSSTTSTQGTAALTACKLSYVSAGMVGSKVAGNPFWGTLGGQGTTESILAMPGGQFSTNAIGTTSSIPLSKITYNIRPYWQMIYEA